MQEHTTGIDDKTITYEIERYEVRTNISHEYLDKRRLRGIDEKYRSGLTAVLRKRLLAQMVQALGPADTFVLARTTKLWVEGTITTHPLLVCYFRFVRNVRLEHRQYIEDHIDDTDVGAFHFVDT